MKNNGFLFKCLSCGRIWESFQLQFKKILFIYKIARNRKEERNAMCPYCKEERFEIYRKIKANSN